MRRKKVQTDLPNDELILRCMSIFGSKVALTKRTWNHIKNRHPEVLQLEDLFGIVKESIEQPDFVAKGRTDEHISLKRISNTHRFLAVFYIEEGRVKTLLITSKPESFKRRGMILPK